MSFKSNPPMNRQVRFVDRLCRFVVRKILENSDHKFIHNFALRILNNISSLQHLQFCYLLYCGILNRQYIRYLRKNNFTFAIYKKIEWAKFILKASRNKYEKFVANHYLTLLSRYGYVETNIYKDKFFDSFKIKKNKRKTFYLYGPNVKNSPNPNYYDHVIVLTKDIDEDIRNYDDSILFMNSIYYRKIIKNNLIKKNILLKKYGKIYVSSILPIQDKEFKHSLMPPNSELGGAMALGRILYNLIDSYGIINCIIEGYDCYLDSEAYSKTILL